MPLWLICDEKAVAAPNGVVAEGMQYEHSSRQAWPSHALFFASVYAFYSFLGCRVRCRRSNVGGLRCHPPADTTPYWSISPYLPCFTVFASGFTQHCLESRCKARPFIPACAPGLITFPLSL